MRVYMYIVDCSMSRSAYTTKEAALKAARRSFNKMIRDRKLLGKDLCKGLCDASNSVGLCFDDEIKKEQSDWVCIESYLVKGI